MTGLARTLASRKTANVDVLLVIEQLGLDVIHRCRSGFHHRFAPKPAVLGVGRVVTVPELDQCLFHTDLPWGPDHDLARRANFLMACS